MGIKIREATAEDAFEYAANHIACWQAAYKGIISNEYLENMPIEQMAERNRITLSEPGSFSYYYAQLNGRMIGRLVIGKCRDEDKPDQGEIAAIYLLEEFWGKGYGREMMEFSLSELKRKGYGEVLIWVLEDNNRARLFYEKCGFAFDGSTQEISIDKSYTEMRYGRAL